MKVDKLDNIMISDIVNTLFKTKGMIGLDIGTDFVKMVQLGARVKKPVIKNVCNLPLDLPLNVSDKNKIDIIAEAVRKNLKQFSSRNAAIVLSGNDVKINFVRIPAVSKNDFESSYKAEAEKIYFNIDDYVIRYDILGDVKEEDSLKTEVVFVAVKKKVLEEKINIAQNAGLTPLVLTAAPFAFEKLYNSFEKQNNENVLVVDIGIKSCGMYIFCSGKLSSVRYVNLGVSSVDNRICKWLNVNKNDLPDLKKRYSLPLGDNDKLEILGRFVKEEISVTRAFSLFLNDLCAEIDPFVYLFERDISKIYLTGCNFTVANITEYISAKLKIDVEKLPVSDWFSSKNNKKYLDDLQEYSIAAGASLYEREAGKK